MTAGTLGLELAAVFLMTAPPAAQGEMTFVSKGIQQKDAQPLDLV